MRLPPGSARAARLAEQAAWEAEEAELWRDEIHEKSTTPKVHPPLVAALVVWVVLCGETTKPQGQVPRAQQRRCRKAATQTRETGDVRRSRPNDVD